MYITTQYLANEEKNVVANSKVEALKAEALGLRNDLGLLWMPLTPLRSKPKS